MFRSIVKPVLLSAVLVVSPFSSAADVDNKNPYQLVTDLGQELFKSVSDAKKSGTGTPADMEQIVEELLMPHIDVAFASYKILGSHLRKTTKQEREAFVAAMADELKQTYSSALAQYEDQSIRYEAVRDVSTEKMVAVKTTLLSPNSNNIDMTFKLRKNRKTNEWRAYDLVVEGISLIDSKRAELAKPLRDKGVQYVTQLVAE